MKSSTQAVNPKQPNTHHPEYPERFTIENNLLTDRSGGVHYKPREIEIRGYFRLNGNALPQDNGMVYLIETVDGRKGTLIYKFDVFTDSKVFTFLKEYVDFKNIGNFPRESRIPSTNM